MRVNPATAKETMETCPFCGVVTETPHETQEGCIEALHAEIARVRDVLSHVQSAEVPGPEDEKGSDPGQTPFLGARRGDANGNGTTS